MFSTKLQRRNNRTPKTRFPVVGMLLASIAAVGCGAHPKIEISQPRSTPDKTVSIGEMTAEFNVGQIDPMNESHVKFQLVNRSAEAILIDSVKTSCGCLKADDHPERLSPDEQGEITLSIDSHRRPGRFEQKVRILGKTPAGDTRETCVNLKGFVRGIIVEQSHARMGVVSVGHQVTVSGTLVGHSDTVQIHVSPSENLGVVETSIDPAGNSPLRSFHVRMVVKSGKEAKSIHEQLDVSVVTSTNTYQTPVVVSGLIAGPIRVTPSAIVFNLRSVSKGKDSTTVTIALLETQESIENVELDFDRELFRVAIEAQSPREVQYRISVNSSSASKVYNSAIDVRDGDRLVTRIPVVVIP